MPVTVCDFGPKGGLAAFPAGKQDVPFYFVLFDLDYAPCSLIYIGLDSECNRALRLLPYVSIYSQDKSATRCNSRLTFNGNAQTAAETWVGILGAAAAETEPPPEGATEPAMKGFTPVV